MYKVVLYYDSMKFGNGNSLLHPYITWNIYISNGVTSSYWDVTLLRLGYHV